MNEFGKVALLRSLFHQHHVISDRLQHRWVFRERLVNGLTVSYFLDGLSLMRTGSVPARLSAQLQCRSELTELIVHLQDLHVGRPDQHVGTWMVNRFLAVLRVLDTALPVRTVSLEFSPVDERMATNRERRARFFRRFGFQLPAEDRADRADTPFAQLKPVPCEDVRALDVDDILLDWLRQAHAMEEERR